jgi:hypothetical protein
MSSIENLIQKDSLLHFFYYILNGELYTQTYLKTGK